MVRHVITCYDQEISMENNVSLILLVSHTNETLEKKKKRKKKYSGDLITISVLIYFFFKVIYVYFLSNFQL